MTSEICAHLSLPLTFSYLQVLSRWPHVSGPEEPSSFHRNPSWLTALCENRSLLFPFPSTVELHLVKRKSTGVHITSTTLLHSLQQVIYPLKDIYPASGIRSWPSSCKTMSDSIIVSESEIKPSLYYWALLGSIECSTLWELLLPFSGSVDDDRIIQFLELAGVVGASFSENYFITNTLSFASWKLFIRSCWL